MLDKIDCEGFYLYRRAKGGYWQCGFNDQMGERHRVSTKEKSLKAAKEFASTLASNVKEIKSKERTTTYTYKHLPDIYDADWITTLSSPDANNIFNSLWKSISHRSRSRNKELMKRCEFDELIMQCNGYCEITGLRFDLSKNARNPLRPSIDRADNGKGYTRGNCRVILLAVNLAMNSWGVEVFREIVAGYVKTAVTKHSSKL